MQTKITTFYSFKGGVGRSMALANVARVLQVRHRLRVACVDMDLHAPGLHYYLGVGRDELESRPGVLDYFQAAIRAVRAEDPDQLPDVRSYLQPTRAPQEVGDLPELLLLSCGRQGPDYAAAVEDFDWHEFYARHAGFRVIELLKQQLRDCADVVLVDARTGSSEVASVAVAQMPDMLAFLFPTNTAGVTSLEACVRAFTRPDQPHRQHLDQLRVVPLLARVHTDEHALFERWQADHLQPVVSKLVAERLLSPEHLTPRGLPARLQQVSRWAYGEHDEVGLVRDDQLGETYVDLAENLVLFAQSEQWRLRTLHAPTAEGEATDGESESTDPADSAIASYRAGVKASARGEYETALQHLRSSLSINRELEHQSGLAATYNQIGLVQILRGDMAEAEEALRKSLAIAEALGTQDLGRVRLNLASVHVKNGKLAEAVPLLGQAALDAVRAADDQVMPAIEAELTMTLQQVKESDDQVLQAALHTAIGEARLAAGQLLDARLHLQEARSLLPDGSEGALEALASLVEIADRLGEADEAEALREKLGASASAEEEPAPFPAQELVRSLASSIPLRTEQAIGQLQQHVERGGRLAYSTWGDLAALVTKAASQEIRARAVDVFRVARNQTYHQAFFRLWLNSAPHELRLQAAFQAYFRDLGQAWRWLLAIARTSNPAPHVVTGILSLFQEVLNDRARLEGLDDAGLETMAMTAEALRDGDPALANQVYRRIMLRDLASADDE